MIAVELTWPWIVGVWLLAIVFIVALCHISERGGR